MRLSEDEPYGVKGANVIVKFSKLQNKQNDSKDQESKFSKIRRSSNLSSCSTSSDNDSMTGFENAETLGVFEMCKDTVRYFRNYRINPCRLNQKQLRSTNNKNIFQS